MPRTATGFTLIEVLVSLVVLSVGLLGLAGLQMLNLRASHSAYLRTQASLAAYDMLDRMRANRAQAVPASGSSAYNLDLSSTPALSDSPTVAEEDLVAWITYLGNTLPAGDGSVSLSGATATIVVQWDDSRGAAGDSGNAAQQFSMTSQL
jgi:type IV pilus assembly protein PilV